MTSIIPLDPPIPQIHPNPCSDNTPLPPKYPLTSPLHRRTSMPRYFIELAYKGTKYSGFQVQENANTIQAEVEKAFQTIHRQPVQLTGSSRTDAGVHAMQNFFHL